MLINAASHISEHTYIVNEHFKGGDPLDISFLRFEILFGRQNNYF